MVNTTRITFTVILSLCLLSMFGCGENSELNILIDGSSTVYPITEAIAEEFRSVQPDIRVTVGVSGTGGGFKQFTVGEIDINDASRPIKKEEIDAAAANGIEFIEIPVAFDGLSIVANMNNAFIDHLTVSELNQIWKPGSKVMNWNDVRPEWPDMPIALYGPGTDSGTFDYFTEVINGESGACRSDFTASEDDNILVQGIAGDRNALGFFGFAYYIENSEKLKLVPIDPGTGPIAPSMETINTGTYAPLSRPIFIYVSTKAADRPEVKAFVNFYLENAEQLVKDVGYVPLPEKLYKLGLERFEKKITGSVYTGKNTMGKDIVKLYS